MSRFFRRNGLHVQVVPNPQALEKMSSDEVERNIYEGAQVAAAYADVIKDVVTHSAIVIGGTVAAVAIIKRICK